MLNSFSGTRSGLLATWSEPKTTPNLKILTAIFCIFCVDFILAWAQEISLKDFSFSFAFVCFLTSTAALIELRLSKRLATLLYFLTFWVVFSVTGKVFTYLCAGLNFPLQDRGISALDAAVGFDWFIWWTYVQSHPNLHQLFVLAYKSLQVQTVVAIVLFSMFKKKGHGEEFWWTTFIALIVTSLVSGFFPALGTFYSYDQTRHLATHVPDYLAMRNGTLSSLPVLELGGIITLPSFHAASAVLLTYPYRHIKPVFVLLILLNSSMLFATPTEGGHYLVDVVMGVVVAAMSIYGYRVMLSKTTRSNL